MFWIANRPLSRSTNGITVMILTSANSDINRYVDIHSLLVFLCFNFFVLCYLPPVHWTVSVTKTSVLHFKQNFQTFVDTTIFILSSCERKDVPWDIFNVIKLHEKRLLLMIGRRSNDIFPHGLKVFHSCFFGFFFFFYHLAKWSGSWDSFKPNE